jgi:3-oxoadipate CoA-transferase beta subunit
VADAGRAIGRGGMTANAARWSREAMAARVARDIPEGAVVNLGIGMPTLVGAHFGAARDVILQSENGLIGMGPPAAPGHEDLDLINASRLPVTLLPGGAYFHHADSFAMIRGGHVDYCVLGAFQVSIAGDLANWHTGEPGAIPAVGGAMDLASGARHVFVMMDHLTKAGESKIVASLTYPVTALACVGRIYTDLAVLDVTPQGLSVREIVDGVSIEELRRVTGVPLVEANASG